MLSFPLAIQTAYQDLLETHKMRAVSEIPGKPFLKDRTDKGKYWYARQRIADRVIDRYLGPDTPERRQLIVARERQIDDQKIVEKRCAALVAQLRAAGLPTLDRDTGKVLNAMARIGTFRLGGTLVGTHAFRLYSAELGVRLDSALAITEDVDVAAFEGLKLVVEDNVDPSLADTFKELRFEPAPGMDPKNRPTRWIMQGGGTMVDFLVPKMREATDALLLKPLGIYAQPLSFLNFLIADPVPAVGLYRSGVLVQIPRPERYAIHKLIVAQRRRGDMAAKTRKDLAQASFLIDVLAEDRPFELADAYQTAMSSGPKWKEAIDGALTRLPEVKTKLASII